MGGLFGVASSSDCVFDLFFGVDYHSHLGTKRGGLTVYGEKGFERSIHNIENSPFRTKFENDIVSMQGCLGIGCISDTEPQPLIVRSHLGTYAITTVGRINNMPQLTKKMFEVGTTHFLEMSGGDINPTEMVAAMINKKSTIEEGITYAQENIEGSMSILLMTREGIYAARDRMGRTPLIIGKKDGAHCVSFESFAYMNLGYSDYSELGPGEIDFITADTIRVLRKPRSEMKICTFLWVYFGYPNSRYEGVNVESMRYKCGDLLAQRDDVTPDIVAGVPDTGTAHAIGYANRSSAPFARPFIKYTPTWPRSFMPQHQNQRNLVAKMKLVPVAELIKNKSMVLIDDSIVRGTQLSETADFLYSSGAKEVHVRPACPPIMFGCKYLNFSRSESDMALISRRIIDKREDGKVTPELLKEYADPDSKKYGCMLEDIRKKLNFSTLRYHRLDDLMASVGIDPCKLCTYCWNGES